MTLFDFHFGQSPKSGLENPGSRNPGPEKVAIHVPLPHIDCCAQENWNLAPGETMTVLQSQPLSTDLNITEATEALYKDLLERCPAGSIYRIWNFVPNINARFGAIDQYMMFCKGRALAYDAADVADAELAAASALGYQTDHEGGHGYPILAVVLTGPELFVAIENPQQTPAYQYPQTYGPNAPSFARAIAVSDGRFLASGTASIVNSESMFPAQPQSQAVLAAENLLLLLEQANISVAEQPAVLRVYVRDPDHWQEVRTGIEARLPLNQMQVCVVQAEICRPELLVELELSIW